MFSFESQVEPKVFDAVWGLFTGAIVEKIKDATERKKIEEKLKEYLSRELDKNLHVSREEEIDFEGLANYIRGDLLEDVERCLCGQTEERKFAREKILEKSVTYAGANTRFSTERARKMVSDIIKILKKFRYDRAPINDRIMSAEIIDDVNRNTTEQIQRSTDEIKQAINCLPIMSLDNNILLLKDGNIGAVEDNINTLASALSSAHPLSAYFRYEMKPIGNRNRLVSAPINLEACKLYPPKIKGIAELEIEGVDKKFGDDDIFNYANRHQLDITMTVRDAVKVLGPIKDPSQAEAEAIKGKKCIISPKPFPPAFPCCITGDGKTIVNYLLLRTIDISDDGVYTITNDEQKNRKFGFTLKFNPKNKRTDFNFSAHGFGNPGRLRILKIMRDLRQCNDIRVCLLDQDAELICERLDELDSAEICSMEEEISIFEQVLSIEKYFGTELNVPEYNTRTQIEYLAYISGLICDGVCQSEWDELFCDLDIDEQMKKDLLHASNKEYRIQRDGTVKLDLWGKRFTLPISRIYFCAKIDNYEKLKQKLEVLDIGDTIKVKFVPGTGGNTVQDRLLIKSGASS